jgi:purine-nucleoside phosphorylase
MYHETTRDTILKLCGVDLETAATFAVAHRFGMACASVLVCSDVVVAGDSLLKVDGREEARARYRRATTVMEEAVLRVIG